MTTFPNATLEKTKRSIESGMPPEKSLMNKRVLVDCKKGREAITVAFYDYRGYHCCVWIDIWDNNIPLRKQSGHGKGSTEQKALVTALNNTGVTFDSPIPDNLMTHQQIEGVMHSIADALGIEHPRVITHAWR